MSFAKSLLLRVGIDDRGIDRGLSKAKSKIETGFSGISKAVVGAGAAATGGFLIADKISSSVGGLESLRYQLGKSKSDFDDVRYSVYELNEALALRSVDKSIESLKLARRYSGLAGDGLQEIAYSSGLIAKEYGQQEDILKAQVSLMRDYKVSSTEAADAILYLKRKGGDLKNELYDTLLEYAPQFKDAGMSFKESIQFMSAGLENSWSVDKVGDLAKEMNLRIQGVETATVKQLNRLGLSHLIEQVKKGEKSSFDVFKELYAGKFGESKFSQLSIGKDLFGTQFEDLGKENVRAILEGAEKEIKFGGELERLRKDFESRSPFKFDQSVSKVVNSLNDSLISLQPVLTQIVDRINSVTKGISSISKDFPFLTRSAVDFALALTTAVLSVGALKKVKGLASVFSKNTKNPLDSLGSSGVSSKVKNNSLKPSKSLKSSNAFSHVGGGVSSASNSNLKSKVIGSAKSVGKFAAAVTLFGGVAYALKEMFDYQVKKAKESQTPEEKKASKSFIEKETVKAKKIYELEQNFWGSLKNILINSFIPSFAGGGFSFTPSPSPSMKEKEVNRTDIKNGESFVSSKIDNSKTTHVTHKEIHHHYDNSKTYHSIESRELDYDQYMSNLTRIYE